MGQITRNRAVDICDRVEDMYLVVVRDRRDAIEVAGPVNYFEVPRRVVPRVTQPVVGDVEVEDVELTTECYGCHLVVKGGLDSSTDGAVAVQDFGSPSRGVLPRVTKIVGAVRVEDMWLIVERC